MKSIAPPITMICRCQPLANAIPDPTLIILSALWSYQYSVPWSWQLSCSSRALSPTTGTRIGEKSICSSIHRSWISIQLPYSNTAKEEIYQCPSRSVWACFPFIALRHSRTIIIPILFLDADSSYSACVIFATHRASHFPYMVEASRKCLFLLWSSILKSSVLKYHSLLFCYSVLRGFVSTSSCRLLWHHWHVRF